MRKLIVLFMFFLFAYGCSKEPLHMGQRQLDTYESNLELIKQLNGQLKTIVSIDGDLEIHDQMSEKELQNLLGIDQYRELLYLSSRINWQLLTRDGNQDRLSDDLFEHPAIDEANLIEGNAVATPCYNSWESSRRSASVTYVACAIASSETGFGPILCTAAYGLQLLIIEDAYNKCLKTNYGYKSG